MKFYDILLMAVENMDNGTYRVTLYTAKDEIVYNIKSKKDLYDLQNRVTKVLKR